MYPILEKVKLNPHVTKMVVHAPLVAKRAKAGQFVILRATSLGERIPLTVADYDRNAGTVTVIYQTVGATTRLLDALSIGDSIPDFVGPLGNPTEVDGYQDVAVVAGGVGCAIALPVAKAFQEAGCRVHGILGFRSGELVILEEEFRRYCHTVSFMSDDGTWGKQGLVTEALDAHLNMGNPCEKVVTVGPLPMMKYVCEVAKRYGIPSVASMNPIMIDGTGMCGGCRLTVGGKTVFACVDGPEFDGALIDFDSAIRRNRMYGEFEKHRYESTCHLFEKEGI